MQNCEHNPINGFHHTSTDGKAELWIRLPEGSTGNGICFNRAGEIFVADYTGHNILKLSPTGNVVQTIRLPGSLPSNLCFGGPDGRTVYVTEVENRQVLRFRVGRPGLARRRQETMPY